LLHIVKGDDARAALDGSPYVLAIAPYAYAPVRHPVRTVGVGYDGSAEGQAAALAGVGLAARHRAALKLLWVVSESDVRAEQPGSSGRAETAVELTERITGHLKDLAAVDGNGIGPIDAEAVYGDPAEELERFTHYVDLLVVGTSGYGPIERVVHGSVLNHLSEHAACPLIVVPPSGPAERS